MFEGKREDRQPSAPVPVSYTHLFLSGDIAKWGIRVLQTHALPLGYVAG